MILPIQIIGNSVLKENAREIDNSYPNIIKLTADMYETMYNAEGVGLAAPQVGLPIRMFVFDIDFLKEDNPEFEGQKRVMINPVITNYSEENDSQEEGCLSIPGVHESVKRSTQITIKYFDEHFVVHEEQFSGFAARVIQHEYDHLDGTLFTDRITPIRKQLIKNRLMNVAKGKMNCSYPSRLTKKI